MAASALHFAGFILDLTRLSLRGAAGEIGLRPKSFEVLRFLLEHGGRVVTKDELIHAVWPDVTVTDESVTRCISEIRQALGDTDQSLIKTIPRRGYLLDVPVEVSSGKATAPSRHEVEEPAAAPGQLPAAPLGTGGHERRQLTILVCTLVDAAAYSSRLDPEDLHDLMNAFHTSVQHVIERHGGFNARSTADGTTGYFGYPIAHEEDAERAVHAALEAIKAVAGLVLPRAPDGVQARAAIATGLVVVGDTRSAGAQTEHVLAGEAPLLAARLCALASSGTIVISAATHRQIGGLFEYRDLDDAECKRGLAPAEASVVLRAGAIASRFDALQRSGRSLFVGRVDELETLLRLWGQAASVAGRVVQIVGEPGIGKSRLTQALLDRLRDEPHIRLRYFCSPNHTDSALHPIISQISDAAGIDRHDDADQKRAKLENLLKSAGQSLEEKVPLLAPLLSIPLGDGYSPLSLSPPRRKQQTFGALVDLLTGVADRKSVLMVFEDAHWIDPTSLEFLALLIDKAPAMPLLLIITARPEFTPSWPMHAHVSMLHLGRLGQADGEALARGLVGGRSLPRELLREINSHTDGVPLFVEELTRSVLESGVLAEESGGFVLTRPLPALSIPSTLHASLLARLDRLGPAKRIAQQAAVIGRDFSYPLIASLAELPEQELRAGLDRLVSAGLVFSRGLPPDANYFFKHALLRDAAYGSLLRGPRRTMHGALAARLTANTDADLSVGPEIIAHHCAEAGLIDAAIRHFLIAGTDAVARSALAEATALFEKALAQVAQLPEGHDRDARELEILSARGASLIAVRGYGAAETGQAYARAKELWDRLGKPLTQVHIVRGLWLYHLGHSEYGKAHALAKEVHALSRRNQDLEGEILSLHCLGAIAMFRGSLTDARKIIEEAHHLYDGNSGRQLFKNQPGYDPNVLGLALLGWNLSLLGFPEQAAARCAESVRRAHRSGRPMDLVSSLEIRTKLPLPALTDEEFGADCEAIQAAAEQHGFPYWIAEAAILRGELELRRGNAAGAAAMMLEGIAAQRAGGASFWRAHYALQLGTALEQSGQPGEALAILDRAILAAEQTDDRWYLAELFRKRGLLRLADKPVDPALGDADLAKSLEIARAQNAKLWELRAAVAIAERLRSAGRIRDAHKLLQPVYAWFKEGRSTGDLVAAKALLDQLK